MYSPIPFTCSHVCGCTARNLNTPFPQEKKKLTTWSSGALPAFFISELLLSASKTAKVTGEKKSRNLTKCSNLWVCRATRDKAAETVVQLLETPFVVHPLEREFCDKHSVKYLGKTISWQGKKRQQNGTVSNWRVSECPSNACSSIYLKLYLPPPHFPSAPLRPQVCVGVIVLATHKKEKQKRIQSSKKSTNPTVKWQR